MRTARWVSISGSATITTWLSHAGEHARTLQLDELRTRLRCTKEVLWLWLVIDATTKLFHVLHLGPRTQNVAHRVIHSLRHILAPGCIPLFTSDGLNLYFYALTAHFGQWLEVGRRGRKVRQWRVTAGLIYRQVKKNYRCRKLVRVTHVMRLATEADLTVALQRLTSQIGCCLMSWGTGEGTLRRAQLEPHLEKRRPV